MCSVREYYSIIYNKKGVHIMLQYCIWKIMHYKSFTHLKTVETYWPYSYLLFLLKYCLENRNGESDTFCYCQHCCYLDDNKEDICPNDFSTLSCHCIKNQLFFQYYLSHIGWGFFCKGAMLLSKGTAEHKRQGTFRSNCLHLWC